MFDPVLTSTSNRKIVLGITAVFSICLFLSIWLYPLYDLLSSYERPPSISFDSAKWKDEFLLKTERHIRIQMIDDLIKSYDLKGKNKGEIIELLGQPSKSGMFSDWDMVYWIGPERHPISIDSEWLVIRFDDKQQVSEYRIVTD